MQGKTDLLQGLVIDKAGGILGKVELTLLNVLAELPVSRRRISAIPEAGIPRGSLAILPLRGGGRGDLHVGQRASLR